MKFWSPRSVRNSLDAHSAIGLVVGVLLYLICLTGTLAALAESFERWEQPEISEFLAPEQGALANALAQYRQQVETMPESLWFVLPTPAIPRMHVSDGEREWFTTAAGDFQEAPTEGWTHMLRELHMRLHLPTTIGMTLVSALGAMLIALIISGIFAHPRLFKDAFRLRLGGSRRLEQADLHNRLSVWGLPFHLMIAITGAFYGLVGVLAFSVAALFYDGDSNALFEEVYGADPVFDEKVIPVDTERAMASLKQLHPGVSPIYLVIHKLDTRGQFMEIAATVPGRLAYSEIYRFDAGGTYVNSQQLTTGPGGRQFLYSLYRIHFGYFGAYATRILWALLGFALTVVCVSGVNVWLGRRGKEDWVTDAWSALVWGCPAALAGSAFGSLAFAAAALPVFLVLLVLSLALGLLLGAAAVKEHLLSFCGATMVVLGIWHWLNYSPQHIDSVSTIMNAALFVVGALLCLYPRLRFRR